MVKMIRSIGRVLCHAENTALGVIMAGILVIVMYGVITRYLMVGVTATAWGEVTVRFLLACIAFWGSSVVLRERGHFKVDLLVKRLPYKPQLIVHILVNLAIMALLVVIAKECLGIIPEQMKQTTIGVFGLPVGLWPLVVLIMAVLMLCYLVARLVNNFREVFEKG